MAASDIEWTDWVWNPFRGCWPISDGCLNCYAARQAVRFAGKGGAYEGLAKKGKGKSLPQWTGKGRFVPEKLGEPFSMREPKKIFVASMSDPFFEEFSFEQIAAVFGVMAACPQHTFQLLTKRTDRALKWFEWIDRQSFNRGRVDDRAYLCGRYARSYLPDYHQGFIIRNVKSSTRWPLPNLWMGTSVEDTFTTLRIVDLLKMPAAKHIVSFEPLLEVIDFAYAAPKGRPVTEDIDWAIIGAESGPRRRPCDPDWIRSLVKQCVDAHVPVFLKQAWRGNGIEPTADSGTQHGEIYEMLCSLPFLDGKQYAQFPEAPP